MSTNGTHISENDKHSASGMHSEERRCPIPWCVRHERYDVGHRDEGVFHIGRKGRAGRQTFELRQDHMLREAHPGRPAFWLNGEDVLTVAQAKKLGQAIIDTAAPAI